MVQLVRLCLGLQQDAADQDRAVRVFRAADGNIRRRQRRHCLPAAAAAGSASTDEPAGGALSRAAGVQVRPGHGRPRPRPRAVRGRCGERACAGVPGLAKLDVLQPHRSAVRARCRILCFRLSVVAVRFVVRLRSIRLQCDCRGHRPLHDGRAAVQRPTSRRESGPLKLTSRSWLA